MKHEVLAGAKSLGIPFPAEGDLSSPVQLAYEGNDVYVIELPRDAIVQLKRDMVTGIVSEP